MHDFIFEHGINKISVNKMYLMGRFRSSYVFIPLEFFFFHKNHGILPLGRSEDNFFTLGGDVTVENLGGGDYLGGWCFLVLVGGII